MVFLSQTQRAPRLYWLLPQTGGVAADRDAPNFSMFAATGTGIAVQAGNICAVAPASIPCLHLDSDLTSARSDQGYVRPLLACSLPSDVAAMRPDADAPLAVMLDIVLGETTEDAWAETERLIKGGLSARTAASALIGTAQDIARRIDAYRALGVTDIVLSAPPERAPYDAVRRHVLPLLARARHTASVPEYLPPVRSSGSARALTARGAPPN